MKPPLLTLPVIIYYFQNLKTIGVFDETDPVCLYVMITLSALIIITVTAYTSHSYTSSRGNCSKLQLNGITTSFAVLQQLMFLLGVLRFFTSSLIQQVITEYIIIILSARIFTLYRYTGTVDYLQPFIMHHIPYPDPPLSL